MFENLSGQSGCTTMNLVNVISDLLQESSPDNFAIVALSVIVAVVMVTKYFSE